MKKEKNTDNVEMEELLEESTELLEAPDSNDLKIINPNEVALVEEEDLIPNSVLLGTFNEIKTEISGDRAQVENLIDIFENLVVNDGDASTSSKEALVNLIKIKTDLSDKQIKIADLMTRLKMKERNTFKPYMKQGDKTINIIDSSGAHKQAFLDAIGDNNE